MNILSMYLKNNRRQEELKKKEQEELKNKENCEIKKESIETNSNVTNTVENTQQTNVVEQPANDVKPESAEQIKKEEQVAEVEQQNVEQPENDAQPTTEEQEVSAEPEVKQESDVIPEQEPEVEKIFKITYDGKKYMVHAVNEEQAIKKVEEYNSSNIITIDDNAADDNATEDNTDKETATEETATEETTTEETTTEETVADENTAEEIVENETAVEENVAEEVNTTDNVAVEAETVAENTVTEEVENGFNLTLDDVFDSIAAEIERIVTKVHPESLSNSYDRWVSVITEELGEIVHEINDAYEGKPANKNTFVECVQMSSATIMLAMKFASEHQDMFDKGE